MGININGVGAYFQNGFNSAAKAADRYNPLTDKGRNNIVNDARNNAHGAANNINGAVNSVKAATGNHIRSVHNTVNWVGNKVNREVNKVKAGTRQNIKAAGNTLNAAGNNIKAAGCYSIDAVGSFVGGQAAYAPTINPTRGQHDRNKMNPQGGYNNSKGVCTPERPQLKRKPDGNGYAYEKRPCGRDTKPLRPGETRNVVDGAGKLVQAQGQKDGSTLYINHHGNGYRLPAGTKPGDYRMDVRPDKYPTLRLQVQAEIETNNGYIHKTPDGTRFFVSNTTDKKGNRVVIEIDKDGMPTDGAKVRQYQASKSPKSIFQRLNGENPDRGGVVNTFARLKKTNTVQDRRMKVALDQSFNASFIKPIGGLISLTGDSRLKNASNKVDKVHAENQAAMGVDPTRTLEAATGLGFDAESGYFGGAVLGKVGKVAGATKIARTASTAVQTVGTPALTTVGTAAANDQLSGNTGKEVAVQAGLSVLTSPFASAKVSNRILAGMGEMAITDAAMNRQTTALNLLKSATTSGAGFAGANRVSPGQSTNKNRIEANSGPNPNQGLPRTSRLRNASALKELQQSIQDYKKLRASADPAKRTAYAARVNDARGEAFADFKAARAAGTVKPENRELLGKLVGDAERIDAANRRDAQPQETAQIASRNTTAPQPQAQKLEPTGLGIGRRQALTATEPTNTGERKNLTLTTDAPSNQPAAKATKPGQDVYPAYGKPVPGHVLKDEATRAVNNANNAVKANAPEAVSTHVETLKAIKAKADGTGQIDLAKTVGVHIQHLEGQRRALQWENVTPTMSSNQRRPSGDAGRSGEESSFDELTSLMGTEVFSNDVAFIENRYGRTAFTHNAQYEEHIFASEKNIAKHFRRRVLADRPGQLPTSYSYGGHAAEGLFSKITGRSYTEIVKNVLLRIDELVKAGTLVKIGAGASNAAYLHVPTQQVVRVGRISSAELAATVGFSRIGNQGVGAKIDLAKSLYIPNQLLSAAKTEGLAVLLMERAPGTQLQGNVDQLVPGAKQKIPPAAADALVSMHMNNKTHGDFGTHNVHATANGEVRIIDFDLSSKVTNSMKLGLDLDGLVSILLALDPSIRAQGVTQVRATAMDLYVKAVDRADGPDRHADVYKKHPELYKSHASRFNARKEALKRAASDAFR